MHLEASHTHSLIAFARCSADGPPSPAAKLPEPDAAVRVNLYLPRNGQPIPHAHGIDDALAGPHHATRPHHGPLQLALDHAVLTHDTLAPAGRQVGGQVVGR